MKRVTFQIGLTDSDGGVIPPSRVETLKGQSFDKLAHEYGGYTAYEGLGGWESGGKHFREGSLALTCYTQDLAKIDAVARWLAALWRQKAVMVAVEPVESMRFVGVEEALAA